MVGAHQRCAPILLIGIILKMNCHPPPRLFACSILFLVLALSACSAPGRPNLAPASPTPISFPQLQHRLAPVPLAVSVNGEGIPIPEFNAELARYQQAQAALGNTVSLAIGHESDQG